MATKNSKDQAPAETEVKRVQAVELSTEKQALAVHIWTADELRQGHLDGDAPTTPSAASPAAQEGGSGTEVGTEVTK